MKIRVDVDTMTLDDLEVLEQARLFQEEGGVGKPNWSRVKDLLARLASEDDGSPIPLDEARVRVGKLNVSQLLEVTADLVSTIDRMQAVVVPPQKGTG